MKSYDVSRLPTMITLGYDGENNWRPNRFDCSSLLTNHPNGVITLWLLPEGETQAYPVALDRDGNTVVWTPLSEEMSAATGALQLVCTDGTDVGKSAVVLFRVDESILPGAEHPAAAPSWATQTIERAEAAADRAEEAAESIDVEHLEQTIAAAVEEYLEEHPVEAPVQSVNGKTGAVVLDADDVGALPADTPIPAAVTEQTVAGWGFTKNTGTYSKPSGGIPKDDLASDVQEVLDSAITTDNFGIYLDNEGKVVFPLSVSGTTVTLDTSFIYVYHAYASSRDAVLAVPIGGTADAPDVLSLRPTCFNATAFSVTLIGEHNGNRYSVTLSAASATASPMTGTLVTTPLQELPTVSSTDNGKFLRVVSGAWAAQAVPFQTPRVAMTASDTTPTLDPNKLYVFPEMASLTPTLATPTDNTIVNEYHFIFTSGATATTLTLPATILQPDGFTVEANMHYEISILEGAMTAQGWAVSA